MGPARAQCRSWSCKLLYRLCVPLERSGDSNRGTVTSQGSRSHHGPSLSPSCCASRASRCRWQLPGKVQLLSTGMLHVGMGSHRHDVLCIPIPAAESPVQDYCACPGSPASVHWPGFSAEGQCQPMGEELIPNKDRQTPPPKSSQAVISRNSWKAVSRQAAALGGCWMEWHFPPRLSRGRLEMIKSWGVFFFVFSFLGLLFCPRTSFVPDQAFPRLVPLHTQ